MIVQLQDDIDDAKDDLALKIRFKRAEAGRIRKIQRHNSNNLDHEIESNIEKRDELDSRSNQCYKHRIAELDQELDAITKRKNQISRTEEEVKAALLKLSREEEQTNTELEQKSAAIK